MSWWAVTYLANVRLSSFLTRTVEQGSLRQRDNRLSFSLARKKVKFRTSVLGGGPGGISSSPWFHSHLLRTQWSPAIVTKELPAMGSQAESADTSRTAPTPGTTALNESQRLISGVTDTHHQSTSHQKGMRNTPAPQGLCSLLPYTRNSATYRQQTETTKNFPEEMHVPGHSFPMTYSP